MGRRDGTVSSMAEALNDNPQAERQAQHELVSAVVFSYSKSPF
jgi:hypothetical protein